MQQLQIDLPYADVRAFCERYPIRRLSLFGSVLRDDFNPASDIDVLVEFESGARVTYLDMADMQFELEAILGRSVDLLEPAELSRYFRQQVLETALPLYERS